MNSKVVRKQFNSGKKVCIHCRIEKDQSNFDEPNKFKSMCNECKKFKKEFGKWQAKAKTKFAMGYKLKY